MGDDSSVKGHFRRGEALILQKDWQLAKEDFDLVLVLEPTNKAAKNKSTACLMKLKEEKSKEKKAYQQIFNTMWAEDEALEKENDKKRAEKKAKAKKAAQEEEEEEEEEDPAATDVIGH